ncbi:Putative aliphatic sulfonates transport permease protein SsuC [Mycolicibacterium vanbaalenii]|uniref:Aliphatic sulfonates transport permease protein SsuC n=1 Tax=Mycolicibacterium vanbaalenii TaxID=110539 RepID=A0A5S9R4C3_MYCVN|nr:ABC transporter permease subunit [Mycolicibacterium vanbaalenii]CAA0129440.1 Putative aliphatic sulfonates transport permease protein SsuC [Mycolicibacterium vanbaalenii]
MTAPTTERTTPDRASQTHWLTGPFGASVAAAVVFLLLWQVAGMYGDRIPGPAPVIAAAIREVERGEFFFNFAISMQRFGIGMAISIAIGIAIGLAIGSSRLFDDMFGDVNLVGLAIPAVIWALLCAMWFGFSDTAPIVTVVLSAVPFVVVNVAAGARSIPPALLDMSNSYGVTPARRLRHVVLPAVTGYTVAGIRFGVMSGWNGLLLSEWFGSADGVGHQARYWYDANQMPGFVAWIAFFILFMVLTDRVVLERLSRRAFRWRDAESANTTPAAAPAA